MNHEILHLLDREERQMGRSLAEYQHYTVRKTSDS